MLKEQKGITLIALVITIIVLLILAGITIAMIGSQDSAPNKAAEAKVINEVGAAKDEIVIKASEAVEQWYEDKYVTTGATPAVSAGAAVAGRLIDSTNGMKYSSTTTVQWGTAPVVPTGTNAATADVTFSIKSKDNGLGDNSTKHYTISGTIKSNGSIDWQTGSWQ